MTYLNLYYIFKKEISTTVILYSIPSVSRRLYFLISLLLIVVIGGIATDNVPFFATLFISFIAVVLISSKIFTKKNNKDLLKKYANQYEFTELEKENQTLLIRRIQREKIISHLGEKVNNAEFLKHLIASSSLYQGGVKTELKVKDLGIAAVLIIVINNYFSLLYGEWKTKNTQYEIFDWTMYIIIGLLGFYGAFYLLKGMILNVINTEYHRHNELYAALMDLETIALFK